MAMTSEHRGVTSRHLRTVFAAGAVGSLSDGRLLERFLAGRGDDDSASAFAALVERHGPMVLGVCRSAIGNLHDAEDAAQATFLILAKRAGSIRRADSVASWLFGVALKVAARARVRAARRRAVEQRGAEMKAHADRSDMPPETRSEVHAELERLPERYRAPIVLCHLEGLTNEQAAWQLGLPVRTLQRRLEQGRERLKARLVRRGVGPAVGAGLLSMEPAVEAASEAWIDATARAAAGVAAGRSVVAVASARVVSLVKGAKAALILSRLKPIALIVLAALVVAGGLLGAFAPRRTTSPPQPDPPQTQAAKDTPSTAARRGPLLKGIVVDEQGHPVAGARVSPLGAFSPRSATSNADGTFVVERYGPGSMPQSFLATTGGGRRQGLFRLDDRSQYRGPRSLVRIVLRPAVDVSVTVVDGRGLQVPEAIVSVFERYSAVAEARTDRHGSVVLPVPAETNMQWIVACKPGVGFDYFENEKGGWLTSWSRPPRTARLVLDGVRVVRVRAVDSAGRPVPGVEMITLSLHKTRKMGSLLPSSFPIRTRTDADGIATFDWLPAEIHERMSFVTGFGTESPTYTMTQAPILIPDQPDVPLVAHLYRSARVSGRVTMPDGSPAPDILVKASSAFGGWRWIPGNGETRTAADGSYTMDLPGEHSYLIGVVDDEWAARSLGGIVLHEGIRRTGLDLKLERGALIKGRVTTGPQAKPVAGVPVRLVEEGRTVPAGTFKDQVQDQLEMMNRFVETDESGRYAFRIAPGNYELNGPFLQPMGNEMLTVVAGQEIERNFDVAPDRSTRTVRGIVRAGGVSGPPVANAVMVVAPTEGPIAFPAHGTADAQGCFELPCSGGEVVVYARSADGSLAGMVTVAETEDREITVIAGPATTARGRVVDEHGKPWAAVKVGYSVEVGPAAVRQDVLTDNDGRYTAPGLPARSKCYFYVDDHLGQNQPSRRIEVKDAQPLEVPPLVMDQPLPLPAHVNRP